jgi:hypothetical protein
MDAAIMLGKALGIIALVFAPSWIFGFYRLGDNVWADFTHGWEYDRPFWLMLLAVCILTYIALSFSRHQGLI